MLDSFCKVGRDMSMPVRVVTASLDEGFVWLVGPEAPLEIEMLRENSAVVGVDDGQLAILAGELEGTVRIQLVAHAEPFSDASVNGIAESAAWVRIAADGPISVMEPLSGTRPKRVIDPGDYIVAVARLDDLQFQFDLWESDGSTPVLSLPPLADAVAVQRELVLAAARAHDARTAELQSLVESRRFKQGDSVLRLSAVGAARPRRVARLWESMAEWLEDAAFSDVVDGATYEVATRLARERSLATFVRAIEIKRTILVFELRWAIHDRIRRDLRYTLVTAPSSVTIEIGRSGEDGATYTLSHSGVAEEMLPALRAYWEYAIERAKDLV